MGVQLVSSRFDECADFNLTPGILYKLTFPNGKVYIGITRETLQQRVRRHVVYARSGRHYALSAAIRKHGENSFTCETVAHAESWIALQKLEIDAIREVKIFGHGCYNMTDGGDGSLGVALSDVTKAKISAALSGREQGFSDAHRRRLSEVQKGKVIPLEVRIKMREAAIRRCTDHPMSEEQREMRRANLLGKKRGPYKKRANA